jgi:hypothetical protein
MLGGTAGCGDCGHNRVSGRSWARYNWRALPRCVRSQGNATWGDANATILTGSLLPDESRGRNESSSPRLEKPSNIAMTEPMSSKNFQELRFAILRSFDR